ncbi:SUN domain-containing protein 3 isoform X2 [Pogona vitticeps]
MYSSQRTSRSIYSAEESNEAGNDLDSDTQHLLEKVSQGQRASCTCTDNHPLFLHERENPQFPCPPKKSIIRLIFNLIVLSLITPFCLVKKHCSTLSSGSCAQKIVFWMTLFLLFLGATYMGLFDGSKQLFGEEWEDFSICDLIQNEAKDLRSLKCSTLHLSLLNFILLFSAQSSSLSRHAYHILERKGLEIPPLKEQVENLKSQLDVLSSNRKDIALQAVREVLERYTSKGITTWSVEKMLKKIMEKLDEDYVQMPDYALKSAGASIVESKTTRSYRHDGGKYLWMSFIVLPYVKPPDVILEPNVHPGNCWSFPGKQGETVVRLAKKIIPRAVTIEHISKKVSPTGEISSAPKDFVIYGLNKEEEEEGSFLGQFVYDTEGEIIQTFRLRNESSEFMSHVKLKVLDNWGHPNYTCIYRFRVHGDLEYS